MELKYMLFLKVSFNNFIYYLRQNEYIPMCGKRIVP